MSPLAAFLSRNSVTPGTTLPVVHSMSGYRFEKIWQNGRIESEECDVFVGENLNYFFMGRPAYKVGSREQDAEHWQLPCCFIFDYQSIGSIKRVFPFDSGAHHNGLYPEYIGMMDKMS